MEALPAPWSLPQEPDVQRQRWVLWWGGVTPRKRTQESLRQSGSKELEGTFTLLQSTVISLAQIPVSKLTQSHCGSVVKYRKA